MKNEGGSRAGQNEVGRSFSLQQPDCSLVLLEEITMSPHLRSRPL